MAEHKCTCCSNSTPKTVIPPCPNCKNKGVAVGHVTIASLVIPSIRKNLTKNDYFLCTDPDCETAYYCHDHNEVLSLAAIRIPLHYKKSAKIKYACYCNELTFPEAISTAKKTGFDDWGKVVKAAKGKLRPCACEKKNPFGKCCSGNSFAEAMSSVAAKAKK